MVAPKRNISITDSEKREPSRAIPITDSAAPILAIPLSEIEDPI
jgi:hypothetical protein